MAREIKVNIVGDASSYQKALGKAQTSSSKLGKAVGTGLKVAALGGAAALGGLAVAAKIGFDEFSQGQKELAQTNAVLKSTGRIAGVTAKHVEDLSEALMKQTGIDDELITSGQNLLLTFTGIRNQVGRNNDIFDQATKLSLDLSVAMGTDMRSAALQVGKALNDPFRGYTRLQRIGVSFSDTQENLIKKFEKSGDVMGAQKVILKELRKEFGGSARAAGTTFAGSINILRESFNNWAGDMVGKVMPRLQDFTEKLSKAEGFRAKLKVTFVGIKSGALEAWDALSDAITGTSQSKPLKLKSGKIIEWEAPAAGLAKQIQEGIKSTNWGAIGSEIGKNISSKVKVTADFLNSVLTAALAWVDAHASQLGALGLKLVLTMISKLSDPSFWKDNWQLILAVAITVFPVGRLAGLGAKLGGVLARPFVTVFAKVVNRLPTVLGLALIMAGQVVSRFVVASGKLLLDLFRKIPGWVQAAFRLSAVAAFAAGVRNAAGAVKNAVGNMADFIQRQLGRIPGMTTAVRLAFFGILGPIQLAIAAVQRLIDWISRIPSPGSIVSGIAGAVGSKLPGGATGGHITSGGIMRVHRGEDLVPARITRNAGTGSGGGGSVSVIVVGGDQQAIQWLRNAAAAWERTNGKAAF